jgi:hypothetical protein
MRTAELLLISLPALLIVAWFLGLRHASMRVFMAGAVALAVLGLVLFWFGQQRGFVGRYRPAQLRDGQIVHEAPR